DMLLMLTKSILMFKELKSRNIIDHEHLELFDIDNWRVELDEASAKNDYELQDTLNNNLILIIELDKFLNVNRGRVMPEGFTYNKFFNSNKISDTSTRGGKLFLEKVKIFPPNASHQKCVRKYFFSGSVAASGDIISTFDSGNDFSKVSFGFKFRELYNKATYSVGRKYDIDLYTCLSDKEYYIDIFEKMDNKSKNYYMFYSMFDLDYFFRKNYSRQSYKNELDAYIYSIGRVNSIFNNQMNNHIEQKNRLNFSFPLYETNFDKTSFVYENLLPNSLIEYVSSLFDENKITDDSVKDNESRTKVNEFFSKERDINDRPVREIKEFLRNYKKAFGDWPDREGIDKEYLDRMTVIGNTYQYTKYVKKMMKIIEEYYYEELV
ncbi:MAG: hypothetical protein ACRCXQ_01400, partial [Vagococcus fluvialis]